MLKEFFWIPMLGAVLGFIATWWVKGCIDKYKKHRERKINSRVDELNIEGSWNSFFNEDKVIQSEKVTLKQSGRNISGTMEMNSRVYNFNGLFKNRILVGQYESDNSQKDERGTIVLRFVNENILSGYCTFVFENKQVYNSPYVLNRSSYHKTEDGTFNFCEGCVGSFHCCCNDGKVDMPILLPSEVEKILTETGRNPEYFCENPEGNLFRMKRTEGSKGEGSCVFFINNHCSIYENRPIDCRLFPFDFKEIDGEYWLGYYSGDEVCRKLPKDASQIMACAHSLRPLLDIMLPYMSECTNPIFCERLKSQTFKKLFTVDKIRNDQI